jgi:predicted RNA-binding protein Jag
MNITLANLESFQEAIKQASKVLKCSNSTARLELADNMRKGVTCDFFQLEFEDDEENDEEDEEDNDETNSNNAEDNSKFFLFNCSNMFII